MISKKWGTFALPSFLSKNVRNSSPVPVMDTPMGSDDFGSFCLRTYIQTDALGCRRTTGAHTDYPPHTPVMSSSHQIFADLGNNPGMVRETVAPLASYAAVRHSLH